MNERLLCSQTTSHKITSVGLKPLEKPYPLLQARVLYYYITIIVAEEAYTRALKHCTIKINQIPREERHNNSIRKANNDKRI